MIRFLGSRASAAEKVLLPETGNGLLWSETVGGLIREFRFPPTLLVGLLDNTQAASVGAMDLLADRVGAVEAAIERASERMVVRDVM
ncbi:hypothetical protein [Amycolatopsis sp. lyj-90]|uniref:hypothetical protein n=1 Tax=Amycolatopsis sp. lyj-90 TaxID=2789285 RepID=UPI00397CD521